MVCIDNGILLSHEKNGRMPFTAIWMDPAIVILSQTNLKNMKSKKNDANEFTYKTETDSQTSKTNVQFPKGNVGRE